MAPRHGSPRPHGSLALRATRCLAAGAIGVGVAAIASQQAPAGAAVTPSHHAVSSNHVATSRSTQSAVSIEHHALLRATAVPRAGVTATTFVVNVLADSPLATPTSTTCVDLATGKCSLRAAIGAANNLNKPVVIDLGAHTYSLTDSTDGALVITNYGGTSIVGTGETGTKVVVPIGGNYQAFYVDDGVSGNGAIAFLSDLTVSGATGNYGGGIEVSGTNAALVLDKVDVTHNTANYGGAVACYEANLWATSSSLSGNTANIDGGGLYSYWCSTYLSRTNVNSNVAASNADPGYGGGIYGYYGTVRLLSCTVNNNTAGNATEPGYGAGIADLDDGDTMISTTVDHNTAMDSGGGGGDYVTYATVVATGTSFSYDRALGVASFGGGVYAPAAALLELHKVVISHDSTQSTAAVGGAGGIFVYSDSTANQLMIDEGSQISSDTTGGIVLSSEFGGVRADVADTVFKGDSSALGGAGALYSYTLEYGGNHVSLAGDQFVDNTDAAVDSAGAVMTYAGSYASQTLAMSDCLVQGNADTGLNSSGGVSATQGLYSQVSLVIAGSQVLGNRAPDAGWGGGVAAFQSTANGNVSLQLTRDTINGNVAGSTTEGGLGGGVFASYYTYLAIAGSTIDNNSALAPPADGAQGGGVYDVTYIGATITASTIDGNHATGTGSEGGGVYTYPESGATDVINSTIGANTAATGAGIFLVYYQLVLDGSTIEGNVAGSASVAGAGGGLYNYESVATVTNSTFTANRAVSHGATDGLGGAIYDLDGSTSLYFDTISLNDAAQGGGAYFASGGNGTLRDSILAANHTTSTSTTESECYHVIASGKLSSLGDNVLSRANCVGTLGVGDQLTLQPMLGPLAANGGPTKTMALLAKSDALNAVHGDCLPTDQRGLLRPTSGVCDAGAYQHAQAKPKPKK